MRKLLGFIFCITWLLSATSSLSAQSHYIEGRVLDNETGEAVAGVNILIKGTSTGTISDNGGYYILATKEDATLTFSSVGYLVQEIYVGAQNVINVNLSPDILALQEVIVTGYSIEPRKQVTGAVATVAPKDLSVTPTGNVEQMLQGRVAGLTLISNGQPGTTSQVRIRGYGALQGNEPLYVVDGVPTETIDFIAPGDIENLNVLKDAPAASIYGSRAAGGVIVIETKRGNQANSGMQITYDGMFGITVPGKSPDLLNALDQAEWTWNGIRNTAIQHGQDPDYSNHNFVNLYGSGSIPVLPEWLRVGSGTGQDVGDVDLEEEAKRYNIDGKEGPLYLVIPAHHPGTDWYQHLTRNAQVHRHHIGLSGVSTGNRYFVGLGIQDQQGTIIHQQFQRYSLRVNSSFDVISNLRFGENFQATYTDRQNILGRAGGVGSADGEGSTLEDQGRINYDFQNPIQAAYTISPIIPVHDAFGGYGGNASVNGISGNNPVAAMERSGNNQNGNLSLFGNLYLEYEPIERLIARTSFGGQYRSTHRVVYYPDSYEKGYGDGRFLFFEESSWQTQWVWTNSISYQFNLSTDHNFKFLIGQEAQNIGTYREIAGNGSDPFYESVDFINLSTVQAGNVQGEHSNGINFSSYFGSLSYDYREKYLLNLVIRRDGSSRFGKDNRWGTFPAISAGWRLSNEPFFDGVGFVNDLRIRIGYGEMGNSNNVHPNNQFNRFTTSMVYSDYDINGTNSQVSQGFYRNLIGNPAGTWETAITKNIGLDAEFWNGRASLSVDIWRKETKNLLYQFPITVQTGANATSPYVNVGNMTNQGIDMRLAANGQIINHLEYRIEFNGTLLENQLGSLGPGIESFPELVSYGYYGGITPVINKTGFPISSYYGYQVLGLFHDKVEVESAPVQQGAAPGRFRYADIDGNDTINVADRTVLGSPIADFTGGIAVTLSYKRWELQLYGYSSIGNEIYNINKNSTDFFTSAGAPISSRIKNSWSFENPSGDIPLFEDNPEGDNFSTNTQSNSYYVEDGSYFRMQNITLAYNIPTVTCTRWGLSHMRVSAAVNNLFTITDYSGLDPSVGGNLDYNFGIDAGNFPINTNWTLGLNVGF